MPRPVHAGGRVDEVHVGVVQAAQGGPLLAENVRVFAGLQRNVGQFAEQDDAVGTRVRLRRGTENQSQRAFPVVRPGLNLQQGQGVIHSGRPPVPV